MRLLPQASGGINEVNQNIAVGSAVIGLIRRDISDLNASAGDISNNSSHIEQSADDLRQLATKLNRLIGRFKF